MNKEFIPYKQALELKELGFDESCICYYDIEDLYKLKPIPMSEEVNSFKSNTISTMVAAPLYRQAFRWFREKYGLIGHVRESWSFNNIMEYVSQINGTFVNHSFIDKPINRFNTYEEAELACLKKLIEIVKGGNK